MKLLVVDDLTRVRRLMLVVIVAGDSDWSSAGSAPHRESQVLLTIVCLTARLHWTTLSWRYLNYPWQRIVKSLTIILYKVTWEGQDSSYHIRLCDTE